MYEVEWYSEIATMEFPTRLSLPLPDEEDLFIMSLTARNRHWPFIQVEKLTWTI